MVRSLSSQTSWVEWTHLIQAIKTSSLRAFRPSSLSLSHSVVSLDLKCWSQISLHQLLCPQAAISCTSPVTCNLEWGHLWLVSLATERGNINGFSDCSIWLAFSYTTLLFSPPSQQILGGSQLCIQALWDGAVECRRLRTRSAFTSTCF